MPSVARAPDHIYPNPSADKVLPRRPFSDSRKSKLQSNWLSSTVSGGPLCSHKEQQRVSLNRMKQCPTGVEHQRRRVPACAKFNPPLWDAGRRLRVRWPFSTKLLVWSHLSRKPRKHCNQEPWEARQGAGRQVTAQGTATRNGEVIGTSLHNYE